jgi:hypothetical protein
MFDVRQVVQILASEGGTDVVTIYEFFFQQEAQICVVPSQHFYKSKEYEVVVEKHVDLNGFH